MSVDDNKESGRTEATRVRVGPRSRNAEQLLFQKHGQFALAGIVATVVSRFMLLSFVLIPMLVPSIGRLHLALLVVCAAVTAGNWYLFTQYARVQLRAIESALVRYSDSRSADSYIFSRGVSISNRLGFSLTQIEPIIWLLMAVGSVYVDILPFNEILPSR